MAESDEFAHGYHYGDYSGVVWYGPPTGRLWPDRLAVSNTYIGPLFWGVLDRAREGLGGDRVPRLALEWNTSTGWTEGVGPTPVGPADAAELAEALARLAPGDVAPHCVGCTPEECLRCAAAIRGFIGVRLARGVGLFMEDD